MTNKEINKYQIALDNVRKAPSFMGGNPKYRYDMCSYIPFEEDIAILQELVNNVNKLQQENESLKETIRINNCINESGIIQDQSAKIAELQEENNQLKLRLKEFKLINELLDGIA